MPERPPDEPRHRNRDNRNRDDQNRDEWRDVSRRRHTVWRSSTSRPVSPATMWSAMLRKRFDERQVGHAGTLDPDATGVLLVGVGKATRLLRFLTALGKTYTADVVLGTSTSTLDASGEVTGTFDMSAVTADMARVVAAEHLTGPIMQVPPMVSALRIDGKRLHELAREGIEVERQPRPVTVYSFDDRRHRRSVGPADRGALLGRHLHPLAGRRPRSTARRRRPSARPSAHGRRQLRRERGPASRPTAS